MFQVAFPKNASPAAIKEGLTSLLERTTTVTTLDDHPGSSTHGQSTNKDTADQGMMRAESLKDAMVWDAEIDVRSQHPCLKTSRVMVINNTLYPNHECHTTSMIGCSPLSPVFHECEPKKYYVAGQILVSGCTCKSGGDSECPQN